jgi:hypothetical protein
LAKGEKMMTNGREFDTTSIYEIRVRGVLNQRWSDWFDGFRIDNQVHDTILVGPVIDQAELHGLLAKIRDLGLPIISVERVNSAGSDSLNGQEVGNE